MHPMGARKIGNIIGATEGQLGRLRDGCARLAKYDRRLREIVPSPLLDHVRLVIVDADRVVLEAESSAWLTRLRFHLPQLKQLLGRELKLRGRKVEIRVAAPSSSFDTTPGQRPVMSKRSARLLVESARSIDDTELSAALRRLARRSE